MHTLPAPYGPPPPVAEHDPRPGLTTVDAFLASQQAHTTWAQAQLDHYRTALALPTYRTPQPCPCPDCTPPAVPLVDEHRPLYGPARPLDRWARLKVEQQHQRRAAAAPSPAPFPRFPSARIRPADALAAALDSGQTLYLHDRNKAARAARRHDPVTDPGDIPTKASQSRGRLSWPDRSETHPAVMTAPYNVLAIPGRLPAPAPDDHELHALHRYSVPAGSPIVLTAGTWTNHTPSGGTVAHRAALDIDGKPSGTGGRAKTSTRPSTVPPGAIKSRNQIHTPNGRIRVWCWLDKFDQVQARTLSGHDVKISTAARTALAQQINGKKAKPTI